MRNVNLVLSGRYLASTLLFVGVTHFGCGKPSEDTTDSDGDGYNDASDCAPNDPSINPGAYEDRDDNVDSDCDGYLSNCTPQNDCDDDGVAAAAGDCDDDDPCVGGESPCSCLADGKGIGACALGVYGCSDGEVVCVPNAPAAEACNGIDDDCNGVTDDQLVDLLVPCSTGAPGLCSEGLTVCESGKIVCDPLYQPSPVEVCDGDGADQNCNGMSDEADGCKCVDGDVITCYGGPPGTAGVGTCHAGQSVCEGGLGYGPCLAQQLPQAEVCDGNGADEDCDGFADVADDQDCNCIIGTTKACYTGPAGTQKVGICHDGEEVCENGKNFGPCFNEQHPEVEVCDGNDVDEDCDGKADLKDSECSCLNGTAKPCKTSLPGICSDGTSFCVAGQYGQCFPNLTPTSETCNGEDDNCNGFVDDVDVGAQAATQTVNCDGAASEFTLVSTPLAACDVVPIVSITRLPANVDYAVNVNIADIANPVATARCSGNANQSLRIRYTIIRMPGTGGVTSANVPFKIVDDPACPLYDYTNYFWSPPSGWPSLEVASFRRAESSTHAGLKFAAAWKNASPAKLRTWFTATGDSLSYEGTLHRMAFHPSLGMGANCLSWCLEPGSHDVVVPKNGTYLAEPIFGVSYFGDAGECPTESGGAQCATAASNHSYELDMTPPHTEGVSGLEAGSSEATFHINHTSNNNNSRLGFWACVVAQ